MFPSFFSRCVYGDSLKYRKDKKMTEEIVAAIKDAEMVLVGLGEEFDEIGISVKDMQYASGREHLEAEGLLWLLPEYNSRYRREFSSDKEKDGIKALNVLAELLQDKNYFVVSTALNHMIPSVSWKENRLVMPCGEMDGKQCPNGCKAGLQKVTEADSKVIADYLNGMYEFLQSPEQKENAIIKQPDIGICPDCGKMLQLNNIYAEQYDESGYLPQWQLYRKWLQGTLNKKLVILELGVGMRFPSVIRWPFEKVAFFNNKAHMYRVNEKLHQLSEELKGKGTAIPKKSVDWLLGL